MRDRQTNYRWVICGMLFLATTINYMDRQVLSLTWKNFIRPEFDWSDVDFGNINAVFSLVYAIANLCSGRFVDWIGTRRGYAIAICLWSIGACMHAVCGIATTTTIEWMSTTAVSQWIDTCTLLQWMHISSTTLTMVSTVSVVFFIISRIILAVGESGNFPAAIKATAEYFPQRDRSFATSIFNAGSTIGALIAPLSIPLIARHFGWEMSFLIIGGLGFLWLGLWLFIYKRPTENPHVNAVELAYIQQDTQYINPDQSPGAPESQAEKKINFWHIVTMKKTWAIVLARLVTDGVWWFLLFWTPAYLNDVYHLQSDNPMAIALLMVLYTLTMLSIFGGKLPTLIMNYSGRSAYDARMLSLLVFALIPLLALASQPLGRISYWFPIIIIGLVGAAHQSWSANMYSIVGDLYPKQCIGTLTGMAGMAAGIGSFTINKASGHLFRYADVTSMHLLGFEGKEAGYYIIFCYCALAYLVGWFILKSLAPRTAKEI